MTLVHGWGRYPVYESEVCAPSSSDEVPALAKASTDFVARGAGRSYGDAAIGTVRTISTRALDRVRSFDPATGRIVADAGVLLADLIRTFLPQGFFPKVVPGTRFVTIGAAIAADIHGKNHHRAGGFGDHVESLLLATVDGGVLRASREENSDVFWATIGGMGLTGIILEATLCFQRVETGWIRQKTIVGSDLAATMAVFEANSAATYSVAWIDGLARGAKLGRSLIYLGEHAKRGELDNKAANRLFPEIGHPRLSIPFTLPNFVLNPISVAAFNEAYFRMGARKAGSRIVVGADPYFFPLDGIGEWNRIYGRRGFVQHQCVIPDKTAASALSDMLDLITRRGDASFLAVLKKLGPAQGLLSFPLEGYTLALDFAVKPGLFPFLDALDKIVVKAGGRLYLAKDSRQSRATFEAGYPALERFRQVRRALDPSGRISSRLSQRLGL
ncbi:FAD-binding oxidoreductase [uncultured Rhodoblastus sp.]|uniref:FAD-binding oxidoreductase n=1 Tax=uncultured Rhodoblastus sp. TaxID=543037 RepID=UPI0025E1C1C3|nr:FAD-binding oxidoreductase [uncultured Rhodoblastus sp.]